MRAIREMIVFMLLLALCAGLTASAEIVESAPLSIHNLWSERTKTDADHSVYYYRLEVPEEGRLAVRLQSWSYRVLYRFWDAALERDFDRTDLWYGTEEEPVNDTLTDMYLPAGVYYAEVLADENYPADFRLVAEFTSGGCNVPEPNQPASRAVPLASGQTARGMLWEDDSYDFFTFTLAEEQTVKITVKAYFYLIGVGLRDGDELKVTDAEGQDVDVEDMWYGNVNEPSSFVMERKLKPGKYFIMINRQGDEQGIYEVTAVGKFANSGFSETALPEMPAAPETPDAQAQPSDGTEAEFWFCPKCGAKNDGNFCPRDGTPNPFAPYGEGE